MTKRIIRRLKASRFENHDVPYPENPKAIPETKR